MSKRLILRGGYKELAAAVVAQALKVLRKEPKTGRQQDELEEVKLWFLSNKKATVLWFDVLGMDQQAAVEALRSQGLLE